MKWIEDGESGVEFTCSEDKPNIFLIGDSIRRGYCLTAKKELTDAANVFYVKDNCRNTQNVITSMKAWVGRFDRPDLVSIVHFNCGHWDVAHWNGYETPLTGEDEYAKNIKMIIVLLRRFFKNAKLIFATTTPMNPKGEKYVVVNPRDNEIIDRYNAIATKIAKEEDVAINDLNTYMRDWGEECFKDYCHLTPESFIRLGKHVAEVLKTYL